MSAVNHKRIITGLKTNFSLSPSYSYHKSLLYHKSLFSNHKSLSNISWRSQHNILHSGGKKVTTRKQAAATDTSQSLLFFFSPSVVTIETPSTKGGIRPRQTSEGHHSECKTPLTAPESLTVTVTWQVNDNNSVVHKFHQRYILRDVILWQDSVW